jgi:hypothetical protein
MNSDNADRPCKFCHGLGYFSVEPGSSLTYPCDCVNKKEEEEDE